MTKRWTASEESTLLHMRRAGQSWEEIGLAIGRRAKTVEWYAFQRMGLVGRRRFEHLKATLKPLPGEGPRPTIVDFMVAGLHGADGRGWGAFLDWDGGR